MNATQGKSRVASTPRISSFRKDGFNAFVERSIIALLVVAATAAVCIRLDIKGVGKDFETMLTLRKLHEIAPASAQGTLMWTTTTGEVQQDDAAALVEDSNPVESSPIAITTASLQTPH